MVGKGQRQAVWDAIWGMCKSAQTRICMIMGTPGPPRVSGPSEPNAFENSSQSRNKPAKKQKLDTASRSKQAPEALPKCSALHLQ